MAGFIGARASVVSSGAERKQTYAITTTTTSLTGLAYTPTKVHVFHNGIRLVDGTDYTATDGETITLTTAAEDGDEVVVISYATFQTSDTVSAANGGTFAGNVAMSGTLGVTGATTLTGQLNTGSILPSTDNASDLGSTSKRFQDLYLSGNTFVGEPSTIGAGEAGVTVRGLGQIRVGRAGTATATLVSFNNGNGEVGRISTSGSSTSYVTSSDYRLKENVTNVTDGITRVKQLAPKRFNFIADPDTTVDGFLAHEAQTVVPEAVSGTHNAVDADGNPEYQGIDQSKLVPLLTAALQEAIAKIETLETEMTSVKSRLDALESA